MILIAGSIKHYANGNVKPWHIKAKAPAREAKAVRKGIDND